MNDCSVAPHIPNNSIGSLAELLGDGVSLVHNEVLVKHLEHLATL